MAKTSWSPSRLERQIDLELLHKAGSYLMVVSAFAALWLGQAFSATVGLGCAVLGMASWFFEPPRVELSRFGRSWTILTVGFVLMCAYLLIFTDQGFVQVGVYLVLFLTLAKLFQRERLADYQQLFALSFLLLAAATAFNEDVTFGAFFILYVVVGVVTFAMHHLRVQLEDSRQRGGQRTRQIFGRQYLTVLAVLGVLIFSSSVAFFFLFPRLGFGFFVQKSRTGAQTTGFSESVNLGTHGTIKDDNTVVMRVEFPEGKPDSTADLHWRGISFDYYDGVRWKSSSDYESVLRADANWSYPLREAGSAPITQQIYLEPIGSAVMFALHPVHRVELAGKDKSATVMLSRHRLTTTPGGDVRHYMRARPRAPFQAMTIGYQYLAYSDTNTPTAARLRAVDDRQRMANLPVEQRAAYIQLPPDNERIVELAKRITAGRDNDYDRVTAIEGYLKSNYTYTTDLPDPGTEAPLDAFLFTHKRGHCEFFATAMVILARSVGIPARNVNGFLGGQWNEYDDFLAVRNADAHSWVEVHFGELGWVQFDPTPPGANVSGRTSWLDPASKFYDSMRYKWMKYIIEYDLETQVEFLRNSFATVSGDEEAARPEKFGFTARDMFLGLRKNLLPGSLVVLLALLGAVAIRLRKGRPLGLLDGLVALVSVGGAVVIVLLMWRPEATSSHLIGAALLPGFSVGLALWSRRRRRHDPSAAVSGVARHYRNLRAALYRYALEPLPAEGPERLVFRVRHELDLPEREAIAEAIVIYMETRFGGAPIERKELKQLGRDVRRFTRALKRARRHQA